jgi:23S rRNA G2445 N2-methylase RlmL
VREDPRFSYRKRDVPAASHPTIAAALARVAGVQNDEVVWDPFVGSGLELIERALLGPYRRLIGSDLDSEALEAARENFASAGIRDAELVRANALEWTPEGVTLIVSNPPMGRRVARDGSIRNLLEQFTRHAYEVLRAGGRVVWLSPLPKLTASAAVRAGFEVARGPALDLGGFDAQIQIFRK